ICPECGGVIGATQIDSQGRSPCGCFKPEPATAVADEREDSSDTVSLPSSSQEPPVDPATKPAKLCILCGKDVSGHRRVKDSRGYLCYDCAKNEIKEEREGTVPCKECGKRIKEAGLIEYNGIKICRKCYNDHQEADKKKFRKVATSQYNAQDKKNVIILAVVFGILGLIVIWRQFFH
ncbi:MAG TPA: hypothetical protein VHD56_01930, partial [Tepidisphaeraceae bacterium]|nr:hypothetical protein [Tepidisphaeraceae bacterium]